MRAGPVVGGIGGIVLLIAALVFGVDPRALLEQSPAPSAATADLDIVPGRSSKPATSRMD